MPGRYWTNGRKNLRNEVMGMPKVGGKKFPYTKKGKKAAKGSKEKMMMRKKQMRRMIGR